jgi:hypothetical protein
MTYRPVRIHCSLAAQLHTGETPSQEIQSCLFSHISSSVRAWGVVWIIVVCPSVCRVMDFARQVEIVVYDKQVE